MPDGAEKKGQARGESVRGIRFAYWGAAGVTEPLKPRRPDKAEPPSGIISAASLPDGALHAYPAYKSEPTATPTLFLSAISQRGVVSPLKSANRSVNDKVWTPWMADRGEPRQGASPGTGEQVESSGAAGIDKGSAAASLVPFTA